MRVIRRSAQLLFAPALGVLLLAACAGGGDEPTATPDDVAAETTEASEPPEDEEAAAGAGGAACLEGEWEADVDVIAQNAVAAPGLEQYAAEAVVTGTSITTFDGSLMTTVYSDQTTDVSWSLGGQQVQTVVGYDGTITGAYTTTDTELTITSVDTSGLTFESSTLLNGQPFDLTGVTDAVADALTQGGTSTYTCTGDELRIQPIAEGVDTSNYVSVMHRR